MRDIREFIVIFSGANDICHTLLEKQLNPIQDGEVGAKRPPTSFSPVTSTNEEISPKTF